MSEMLIPIAISSQLDVTGEERVHAAKYTRTVRADYVASVYQWVDALGDISGDYSLFDTSMAYMDGYYLIHGDSGVILKSVDLATWTAYSVGEEVLPEQNELLVGNSTDLVTDGTVLIAVASGGPDIARTTDAALAASWAAVTSEAGAAPDNAIRAAAYGAGTFVLAGKSDTGNLQISDDAGLTWTLKSSGFGVTINDSIEAGHYANATFVFVGNTADFRAAITKSTDAGLTWTFSHVAAAGFGYADSITYGAGKWIVATQEHGYYYSTDLTTWTRVEWDDVAIPTGGPVTWFPVYGTVGYTNNIFSVVLSNASGGANHIFVSTDGLTWTEETIVPSTGTFGRSIYHSYLNGKRFVVIDDIPTVVLVREPV